MAESVMPGRSWVQAAVSSGAKPALTWAFGLERVTGIEPALSAWEVDRELAACSTDQRDRSRRLRSSARDGPRQTFMILL
jgi:hypothetical protein